VSPATPDPPVTAAAPKRVLGVGIATLDLINEVAAYPPEDAEVRVLEQRVVRGGNCANTLAVLAQLGHACAWVGTLADDTGGGQILADLAARGIATGHAVRVPGAATPTSYVSLSRASGSRTIVHYRRLPELSASDFAAVPLAGLDWVHLEGRAPEETTGIIARIRHEVPGLPISLELEKPRPGIELLLDGPDVLMVSRTYALDQVGADVDPGRFLAELADRASARLLVLGWGAAGAWLLERGGSPLRVPAVAPVRVVDTLGAGDVLNAGVIDGLIRGREAEAVLRGAVYLAGLKCGRLGLDGLADAIGAQLKEPGSIMENRA
jgi:ketohexokinase